MILQTAGLKEPDVLRELDYLHVILHWTRLEVP